MNNYLFGSSSSGSSFAQRVADFWKQFALPTSGIVSPTGVPQVPTSQPEPLYLKKLGATWDSVVDMEIPQFANFLTAVGDISTGYLSTLYRLGVGIDGSIDYNSAGYRTGAVVGLGIQLFLYHKGPEFKFGRNWRIAPWGNRTKNKDGGQLPHYHRRGPTGKNGQTKDGQGIGRHRPWQKSEKDKSWRDRF